MIAEETMSLEKMRAEYMEKKEASGPVTSLDHLCQIEKALDLSCWSVHSGERGFARKWGITKRVAEWAAKRNQLSFDARRRHRAGRNGGNGYDYNELELYITSWVPTAREMVMAEDGGAGFGSSYRWNGYSGYVESAIYNYGTSEEIQFFETVLDRVMTKCSLDFDIYFNVALCMTRKYDNAWFMRHWGNRHPNGIYRQVMEGWVETTPMADDKAREILARFQAVCREASDEFIRKEPTDRGACGFAHVLVPTTDPFGRWMKEHRSETDAFVSGSHVYMPLDRNIPRRQSIDYETAVYRAGWRVLQTFGVDCQFGSRLD